MVSVGLVDSLNPATIAPALVLATAKDARRRLAEFIAAVFVVNAVAGIVLTLGPGRLVIAALPHPGREAKHAFELALGAGALLLAGALWVGRARVDETIRRGEGRAGRSALLLGGGLMVVELPTAFPYFAVIAAVAGSNARVATQVALVLLFNALFVAPLLAILVLRGLSGGHGERAIGVVRTWLHRHAATLIPILVLLVGLVLLAVGGVGLLRD